MKYGKKVIEPATELSGSTLAYQSENTIFVSPAIYTLLHDPQVSEQVMTQVQVVKLQDIIQVELSKVIVEKGFKRILDNKE